MGDIKLTNKQSELILSFIHKREPFWLSVRRSFARSHSNTIDIKSEGFRISLREIRPRRYDTPKDILCRTQETVNVISDFIKDRFPDALYEGVVYAKEAQVGK